MMSTNKKKQSTISSLNHKIKKQRIALDLERSVAIPLPISFIMEDKDPELTWRSGEKGLNFRVLSMGLPITL